ncbi:MAG: glycoside hydrolase family 97 catalytic domain-containing protein [Sandaracinaceae bacterium]|nr:glycoside hydrolase family 97 catalytic domain-containing protein [Sandaracinaceae bacterium]
MLRTVNSGARVAITGWRSQLTLVLTLVAGAAIASVAWGCGGTEAPRAWTVASPDGALELRVVLNAEAAGDERGPNHLTYSLVRNGQTLVASSPLGIETTSEGFVDGLRFVADETRVVHDAYTMIVGKRAEREAHGNEHTLRFRNASGAQLELIVRVHDDGAAFRYRLLGDGPVTVQAEHTAFQLPTSGAGFMMPYDLSGLLFLGVYEQPFQRVQVGDSANASGWAFPTLFEIPGDAGWVLLTEADLDGTYCASRLGRFAPGGLYSMIFPTPREGQQVGEVLPSGTLPLSTPWRVLIAGELSTVVESTLVDDLSPPSTIADTRWITPGRAAWSWLTQDTGDEALQREYLASAAEFGWEHMLIDAHWQEFEDAIPQLVSDAAALGVQVHVWYNSGGPHNVSAEPPRDRMLDRDIRRAEMARLEEWGVAGIKIDFFESDKQDRIQQYLGILEDAAEHHLMVNFHGATLPRGWQRTHPNLMTVEAVRGAEFYRFPVAPADPDIHLMYVFARNVVGSMDYTPVVFQEALADAGLPYISSLAQAVLFESGITHFGGRADADPAEGYRAVFAAFPYVQAFMSEVPSTWDETRLLSGDPRTHAVLARRKGSTWYVAAITSTTDSVDLSVPLAFLGDGAYAMEVIAGGATPDSFTQTASSVTAADSLPVALGPSGGLVVVLRP